MMAGFSPFTRRLIALAILLFALLAAINLAGAVIGGASASLAALGDARFRLARLTALQMRPASPAGAPVSPDFYFTAPDRESAAAQAEAAARQAAASVALPIESLALAPADPEQPLQLALPIAASGPEPAVLAFIAELERSRPAMRLGSWRIVRTGTDPGSLRVEGTVLAVWSKPR